MLPREEGEEDSKMGRAFLPLEERGMKDARVRVMEKETEGK